MANINITKEEVREILVGLTHELNIKKYDVKIQDKPDPYTSLMFWRLPSGIAGLARPEGMVEFFAEVLADTFTLQFNRCPKWYLKLFVRDIKKAVYKALRGTVIHELRHMEQYEFMRENGIDIQKYLKSQKSYFKNPMELDAYLVQFTGIKLPLRWVFRKALEG